MANDSTPNFLFLNNRDGTFSEAAYMAGLALSEDGLKQASMGVDAGDFNNDGAFDLMVTNFSHDTNNLYRNSEAGFFSDVNQRVGLGERSWLSLGWGTGFVDFDNDGFVDLFIVNGHVYPEIGEFGMGTNFGQQNQIYRNIGDGNFEEATSDMGSGLLLEKSSRGAAFDDYDNDGDMDIAVINLNDRPTLLRNDGGNRNHWLKLRLIGRESNRDAIGARVTVRVGDHVQVAEVRSGASYLSHNDMRLNFGLGRATTVDDLKIRWPDGAIETFEGLAADQILIVIQGRGIVAGRSAPVNGAD